MKDAIDGVRELLAEHGDLRYVWRHLPLTDVHPHAQLAAEVDGPNGSPRRAAHPRRVGA